MKTFLPKYPERIEAGLHLTGRQKAVYGRRIDLLFEDRLKRVLLVELKWGPIQDRHIGQLMSYEGALLSSDNPDLRVMLIGTRVPPNIGRSLDHHGIAWKEMRPSDILTFLLAKQDNDLASAFAEVSHPALVRSDLRLPSPAATGVVPALLGVVEKRYLDQAFDELASDKEKYFKTDSPIGKAGDLPVENVYFKVKGTTVVSAEARFIEVTAINPRKKRLRGYENDRGKFYYGFCDLVLLDPVPLTSLRYFTTGQPLRNDVPGSCIVEEPR